jgi:hypothetical protein
LAQGRSNCNFCALSGVYSTHQMWYFLSSRVGGNTEELNNRRSDITEGINPKCTTGVYNGQKLLHGLLENYHIVQQHGQCDQLDLCSTDLVVLLFGKLRTVPLFSPARREYVFLVHPLFLSCRCPWLNGGAWSRIGFDLDRTRLLIMGTERTSLDTFSSSLWGAGRSDG